MTRASITKAKRGASDLIEALDSTRAAIQELAAERLTISHSPVSEAEAVGRIEVWLKDVSARPALRDLAKRFMEPSLRLPPQPLELDLLAAACLEQLGASLVGTVRQMSEAGDGLAAADRHSRLQVIDEQLFNLELSEESIIRSAERLGLDVLRRPKADPRAVLAHDEALP